MTRTTAPAIAGSTRRSTTARATKAEPKPPITIIEACQDPEIFGPWFKDKLTWVAWFAFLKCMFGLRLDPDELAIFQACTGRSAPRPGGYLEATLVIGRRGGKSLNRAERQRLMHRQEKYFGGDGRGCVTLLVRTIMESEGNQDALVESIISAVALAMRPEWTSLGLRLLTRSR
jgi:hypothetical protein